MGKRSGPKPRSGDSGVALILVLLAILVLTTLAAAMVFSARSETLASYNYRVGTQAEYVALAGVQRALNFFNSSSYSPVPPAASTTYYAASTYSVNPVSLYFSNSTPVTCTSGCSSTGNVVLGTSSGSSLFPPAAATGAVNVVTNWVAAMNNQSISDGVGGTGNYTVTATLLEYHTVNNAFFGVAATGCPDALAATGICRQPFEVWQVSSTGTWNSNIGGGVALPTVQVVATISPMYLPFFGNALYGLCNVTLSGNVCTDSYNSTAGNYGGASANSCVTSSTSGTNAQLTGAGVGSNGGVTVNGSSNTVGGNVTYANQNSTSSCNTGFQGTAAGVVGSVLPGPAVPSPPDITTQMTGWGYPTTTPSIAPASSGGSVSKVANVYTKQTTAPPLPPGATAPSGAAATACPAGASGYLEKYTVDTSTSKGTRTNTYSNYTCTILSGSGTAVDPYRLGDVTANSSNPGTINIIGPTTAVSNPIYIAANNITVGTNGAINTSYQAPAEPGSGPIGSTPSYSPTPPSPTSANATALVIDVRNSIDMTGQANMNYNPSTPGVPSPDYLRMNVMGTGTAVSLAGQAQLSAMISAPNGDASLGGSGSSGTFFGSILANNINDHGGYPVHYDLSSRTESGQMFTAQVVSVTRPKM